MATILFTNGRQYDVDGWHERDRDALWIVDETDAKPVTVA